MAPLFDDAGAEVGVLLGEVVELDDVVDDDTVLVLGPAVGKAVAAAPWPDNALVGKAVGNTLTFLAAALKSSNNGMDGGLIAPTIPEVQWGTGSVFAQ